MKLSIYQEKRHTVDQQTGKNVKEKTRRFNESLSKTIKGYCPFPIAKDFEFYSSKKSKKSNKKAASKQSLDREDSKTIIKKVASISGLSNLTIQLKVESCDSSPRKSSIARPASIKPLVLKHDSDKSNTSKNKKILISIDQEAIQRPYNGENHPQIEYQDFPSKKRINYWRNKKIEQYKIAKNISAKTTPIGSPRSGSKALGSDTIFRTFEDPAQSWVPSSIVREKFALSEEKLKKIEKKKFLGEFSQGKRTEKNIQLSKQVPSSFSQRATPNYGTHFLKEKK